MVSETDLKSFQDPQMLGLDSFRRPEIIPARLNLKF